MRKRLKIIALLFLLPAGLTIHSCKISYSFSGSSIDPRVSSIAIKDFPNLAPEYTYPPLSQELTESLKDKFTRQTKLKMVRDNGDLEIEGEITRHSFTPQAPTANMLAAMTRLTIGVRVRYTNKIIPEEDFEQSFSAYYDFSNDRTIDDVQSEACEQIIKEIIDQIFNQTVANW